MQGPAVCTYLMKYSFMMFFVGVLTYNKTNSFYPLQTTTTGSSTSNRVLTTISEQTQVLSPSNLLAMQKQSTLSISQPRLNYATTSTQLGASPESSDLVGGGGGVSHVLGSTAMASSSSKALVPTPTVSVGLQASHLPILNPSHAYGKLGFNHLLC